MAGIYSQGGSASHRYAGWLSEVEAKNFQFGGKVFNGSPSAIYVGSNWVWIGWLKAATKQAIVGAFGQTDGTAVIKATNAYLDGIAAQGQAGKDKATALAAEINKYPVGYAHLFYDFQEVEYIKSTGTQYLKIPFTFGDGITKIGCEYYPDYNEVVFSEWKNTSVGGGISYEHQSNGTQIRAWIGNTTSDWFYANVNMAKHTVLFEDNKWYIDGNLVVEKTQGDISGISNYIFVMARGVGGSLNAASRITLYGYEMFAGNGNGMRLIPCYRVSDNVIGVYDVVNAQFHVNAGSGTFTKGSNTGPTPIYTPSTP